MNTELYSALISRGETPDVATQIIDDMIEQVMSGANPEEVLYENGLEPDYVFDLIHESGVW